MGSRSFPTFFAITSPIAKQAVAAGEGAFKTCYADTDSMALALTRSGPENEDGEQNLRSLFDPIVKPSMKTSWEATWKDWFVTTDEIWDIRKPGKLKGT